ncbi:hypothetical protein TNCV_106661 [Trichonephila clavipes]|nr:hypothetical protein TNCV_106661 [Trichonephila clavipes]
MIGDALPDFGLRYIKQSSTPNGYSFLHFAFSQLTQREKGSWYSLLSSTRTKFKMKFAIKACFLVLVAAVYLAAAEPEPEPG